VPAWGAIIPGGYWLPATGFHPTVVSMYLRHYSAAKNVRRQDYGSRRSRYQYGVAGPGETMALITQLGDAVWIWRHDLVKRLDAQEGVNCTIFRNEGPRQSSSLVLEADQIAWQRWPNAPRHFTYVNGSTIQSANPGYCFKKAGWRHIGYSASGLHILAVDHA
jgi:hypothetical protein